MSMYANFDKTNQLHASRLGLVQQHIFLNLDEIIILSLPIQNIAPYVEYIYKCQTMTSMIQQDYVKFSLQDKPRPYMIQCTIHHSRNDHGQVQNIHMHPSATTRLKTLFSFVVCNRKPYDVILFFMYSCWNF